MKTQFTRNNKTITNLSTDEKSTYASLNRAKRESRLLQQTSGGLGQGSLVKV